MSQEIETKKRGRKPGNTKKWSKKRFHVELQNFDSPNLVLGDFCKYDEIAEELAKHINYSFSRRTIDNILRKRSQSLGLRILIEKI